MAQLLQFWNIAPAPGGCPFAQRAWIALEEKNIKHERHIFSKANKPKDFTQLYHSIWPDINAAPKVPTIIDTDGTRLTESQIVVEYLEQRYKNQGTQLIPDDAVQAAKARLFGDVFISSFSSRALLFAESKQQVQDAKDKLLHAISVLNTFLVTHGNQQGGNYLLGATYSVAEVYTAPFLWRALITLREFRDIDVLQEAEQAGAHRFVDWAKATLDRPSTEQTSMPLDVALENYRDRVPQVQK